MQDSKVWFHLIIRNIFVAKYISFYKTVWVDLTSSWWSKVNKLNRTMNFSASKEFVSACFPTSSFPVSYRNRLRYRSAISGGSAAL